MKYFMRHFLQLFGFGLLLLTTHSCSKLIEVGSPKNQLTTDKVFADSLSAISALGNIYFKLANNLNSNYNKQLSLYTDEFSFTATDEEFYNGQISPNNGTNSNIWNYFYEIIYSCNDILEKLDLTNSLKPRMKSQMINEAKFVRAFCYYHLFILYEHIPLIIETNVDKNRIALQADSTEVFTLIVSDLIEVKKELPIEYPSSDRTRANKWSASALLAQVYLYQQRWQEALDEADAILSSGLYTPISEINEVFLASSKETILQLWRKDGFISDATILIPSSNTVVPRYLIAESLHALFEKDDLRQSNWLGVNNVEMDGVSQAYTFPYKYKNRSGSHSAPEYLKVLRASEQYLIRAEAKAHLGDISGAILDLNIIRKRAGVPEEEAGLEKQTCLELIYRERQIELFNEWAKRFIDLKRTGKLNTVMTTHKVSWKNGVSERLPIPFSELIYNPNLIQNEGYY